MNDGAGNAPDPGLQAERTALAWRRTALAAGVAGLVIGRLTLHHLGIATLAVSGAAVLAAVWVMATAASRYRGMDRTMSAMTPLPDGRTPALLALSVVLLCAVELVAGLAR
jgi:uncharacterized membrane protein YidH (DUF202 family)